MNTFEQKKLDAFCAIAYHESRLNKLRRLDQISEWLGLAVPIIYVAFRFLAKGTDYERPVETIWEILAAALLAMILAKVIFGWTDKIAQHKQQMAANLNLITQADNILQRKKLTNHEVTDDTTLFFTLLADKIEEADRDLLGKIPKSEEISVYRESLKRFGTDVCCPICGLSPFKFVVGPNPCQTCGNSPEPLPAGQGGQQ
ncbi:MAG: hypothetical protein M3347_07960 [Armatimonadota bacterium]|nr:hypothetical protein [Armatimonadota bacterium]